MIMQKPRSKRSLFIFLGIILVLIAGGAVAYYWSTQKKMSARSYAECVAAGNPVMDSYPNQCQANGKTFIDPSVTITLEGTAVCLPHKNSDGPQTLECAVGIKTKDGAYYGVSGDKSNTLATIAGSDKTVRVTGSLEHSDDTIYDIKQIIAVKSIEMGD